VAKNRDRNDSNTATEEASSTSEAQPSQPVETAAPVSTGPNYTLHFKRNHPQDRASYGIAGVPGIVVIQRGMFAGTTPFTSNTDLAGMPATITLDALLVSPKVDNKQAKAEAAAAKAQEKADKAKAKAEAAQKKIEERAAKAAAALEAAKAKVAAAAVEPAKAEGVEGL
jgi:hypothetical protein